MLIDIHSHILPCVDDGAKDLETSLKLIKMMQSQGITDIIATPHFYPDEDTLKDFNLRVKTAYNLLKTSGYDLPNIIIGCELFYFSGISKSEHISKFTLGKSNYILIEPNPCALGRNLMSELLFLRDVLNLTPIVAHVERYYKYRNFKEFVKFIKENEILCQVNASSFLDKYYNRILKKLFKEQVITFIATDTHSLNRPPQMLSALSIIEQRFGTAEKERLINNLNLLRDEIVGKE